MKKEIKATVIGWDVGGWSGRHHGVAVVEVTNGQLHLNRALSGGPLTYAQAETYIKAALQNSAQVQIGIDAPLGFPQDFQRLMQNDFSNKISGAGLSWRYTDIFCKNMLKKAPLSPSFSFLTSNATVAISFMQALKANQELAVLPFDPGKPKEARELYPGLLKSPLFPDRLKEKFREFLKVIGMENTEGQAYYWEGSGAKTDFLDALLCAWYAGGFLSSPHPLFPDMEKEIPVSYREKAKTEGWIYYPKALLI